MKNVQKKVVEWHSSCFPRATEEAILLKLHEEIKELRAAVGGYAIIDGDKDSVVDEINDVIIVACTLLDRWGIRIDHSVLQKLETNKAREWGPEDVNGDRKRVK